MCYEIIDHTADLGISVRGKDINNMFENAGLALFDVILNAEKIEEKKSYDISLDSNTIEDLMVNWLSELIYVFESEELVFKRFNIIINEKNKLHLSAVCYGEVFNKIKHGSKIDVKAITYHNLNIDKEKNEARILFDV